MEKLVEIQKVFKSFGVVKAVDGVTLDIEKGELKFTDSKSEVKA